MGSIYFNGSELTGQHDVKFNGTDMDNVYLNGAKLWTRHPYTPGTTIFTYSWGSGGNNCGIPSSTYPLAFASIGSCGSPDHTLTVTLNDGFYVSSYTQNKGGTDSDGVGASNTGGTFYVWVGQTVTGMYGGTGFSIGSSGNGGSSFTVSYSGQ